MPTHQATAASTFPVVGPPRHRARTASTVTVTGWCFAKPCNQPGMLEVCTKADDANVRGARMGNDAACAASALPMARPIEAKIHNSEKLKRNINSTPAPTPSAFVWNRDRAFKPTIHLHV